MSLETCLLQQSQRQYRSARPSVGCRRCGHVASQRRIEHGICVCRVRDININRRISRFLITSHCSSLDPPWTYSAPLSHHPQPTYLRGVCRAPRRGPWKCGGFKSAPSFVASICAAYTNISNTYSRRPKSAPRLEHGLVAPVGRSRTAQGQIIYIPKQLCTLEESLMLSASPYHDYSQLPIGLRSALKLKTPQTSPPQSTILPTCSAAVHYVLISRL